MQLKPVDQQVVVVFGASSGIGRATALQFADRGARVVVSARGEEGLASLEREIGERGGRATALPADAAIFEQVKAVANRAVELYGHLDTWVHTAAVALYAPFEETTPEEFRRVIEVNLLGQVYGAMAALPHLKREGRGALIHVSSVEAAISLPYHSAYAASKHGIVGFLDALRLELRHDGLPIHVTNVMPASINTPLFNHARTKIGVKPKGVPPVYRPEDVADAILYAAEHPTRDVVVGDAGRLLVMSQRLSPRLTDAFLLRTAFEGQKTDEPKSAEAPDNLYGPIPGFNTVEGDFGHLTQPVSLTDWLSRDSFARRVAVGTALGAALLLGLRGMGNGRRRTIPALR